MFLGVIVELGEENDLYENPFHPYTQALLSSGVPIHDPRKIVRRKRCHIIRRCTSPVNPPRDVGSTIVAH
jgi:ABC-type oligopeptide transport system ATPase subunit